MDAKEIFFADFVSKRSTVWSPTGDRRLTNPMGRLLELYFVADFSSGVRFAKPVAFSCDVVSLPDLSQSGGSQTVTS